MALTDPNRPHAVYRVSDELGRLLYIGCTVNVEQRMTVHRYERQDTWGRLPLSVEVEWHPDLASGRAAEAAAIQAEKPIYNMLHHPDKPTGNRVRLGRPPRDDWQLVWSGPDDPPWVASDKTRKQDTKKEK